MLQPNFTVQCLFSVW